MEHSTYPVPVRGILEGEIEGTGVITPEPQEVIHWLRVRKVFEALQQPGVNHIQDACEIAQVPRTTFYRDLNHPSIPPKLAQWMTSVDAAITGLILSRWVEVLYHQLRVARGDLGVARDSTPAARFVQTELERLRQQVLAEQQSGPSDAAKILTRFRARKAKATRTTVVEELEVEE